MGDIYSFDTGKKVGIKPVVERPKQTMGLQSASLIMVDGTVEVYAGSAFRTYPSALGIYEEANLRAEDVTAERERLLELGCEVGDIKESIRGDKFYLRGTLPLEVANAWK